MYIFEILWIPFTEWMIGFPGTDEVLAGVTMGIFTPYSILTTKCKWYMHSNELLLSFENAILKFYLCQFIFWLNRNIVYY